jgi:hypothetical protein
MCAALLSFEQQPIPLLFISGRRALKLQLDLLAEELKDLELIKLPAGVLRPVPRYGKQAIEVLLAKSHGPLLGFESLHGGGELLFFREVLVVQPHEGYIVGTNVEEHKLILQECVLGELVG